MDVSQVSVSTAAVSSVVRELQAINKMQMAIMKSISDSQKQMTAMLQAAGIGVNVDVRA